VIGTYIDRGKISDPSRVIDKLELAIAVLFTLEFLDDLRRVILSMYIIEPY
jgi:hypothetical protein